MPLRVTLEMARQDLDRILDAKERTAEAYSLAANVIISDFDYVKKFLPDPAMVMLYVGDHGESTFPKAIQEIAQQYSNGGLSYDEAAAALDSTRAQYRMLFQQLGIANIAADCQGLKAKHA